MMLYDFITIGGACEDLSIWTDDGIIATNEQSKLKEKLLGFEYGAKVKVKKYLSTPGGGADNTAVALSRLGFKVLILAAIGADDRGKKIISNLRREGVDTHLIDIVRDKESGFSSGIIGRDNEHVFFPVRGANEKLTIDSRDLAAIKKTKWVYLTSLSGNWQPQLKKIFSVRGLRIAWNPGARQLSVETKILKQYLKKVTVLIVNLAEAKELVFSDKLYHHKKAAWFNTPKNLAAVLAGWGPKVVVITMAGRGAMAFDGKKIYRQPAVKAKKYVNTIGVGDAFGSTFVAGLELFEGEIKKALKIAAKNSAAVVGKYGAQAGLLRRKDLTKIK